jgi:hypothetical protein
VTTPAHDRIQGLLTKTNVRREGSFRRYGESKSKRVLLFLTDQRHEHDHGPGLGPSGRGDRHLSRGPERAERGGTGREGVTLGEQDNRYRRRDGEGAGVRALAVPSADAHLDVLVVTCGVCKSAVLISSSATFAAAAGMRRATSAIWLRWSFMKSPHGR